MIHDSLLNTTYAEKLHPKFKTAFDFIKSTDFTKVEPGKIELEGNDLFVVVAEITGKSKDEAKMETHNKYIDIQVPIIGVETMGWLSGEKCINAIDSYNPDKDITFFTDKPTSYSKVSSGEFAIFFPEDGHAPAIGEGFIKKVIVKVLV